MSRRRGAREGDLCPAGRHPLPVGRKSYQGCAGCKTDHALDEAATRVVAVLPGLDAIQARQALTAAVAGGSARHHASRYRSLAAHLVAYPDALTSGASTTPVDVARLIGELRRLGHPEVADPRCADCARPCFPRHNRPDGLRICRTCDGRRRHVTCGGCGSIRAVCVRAPDGTSRCQRCHYANPATWQPCGRCGQNGPVSGTVHGLRVGGCCYLKPHERCSVCGLGRAVSPYASGKATCADCATGHVAVCARCGLDAPSEDGEPVCLRCRSGVNLSCRVCGGWTVSRDRNGAPQCSTCFIKRPRRCGGCGHERVIKRRGVNGEPDLCSSCWYGPTAICSGCGRLRPCTGQRTGRMLCKTCLPRPKHKCGYCGHIRKVAVNWAAGPTCTSCYRRFMRAKDTCPGCGQHRRLLPYPGQPQAVCAPCADEDPGPVCGQCGNEDWLYRKDRCAHCVLTERLTDLLGDSDNRDQLGLQPLFDTLAHAELPETIIGWTRPSAKGTAHLLLAQLGRGEIPLTHEALDTLNTPGNGGTANHVDAILTAVGALPPRDLELARLERSLTAAVAELANDEHRRNLRSYATWQLLRRARETSRRAPLTAAARQTATTKFATATHLLTWLAGRDADLADLRQPDLDEYVAEHPNRRPYLPAFLTWAHRTRRTIRLRLATRPRLPSRTVEADDDQRWTLARALLHDDDYTAADRVAGLLVLLFGQRPHRISRLTTSHVNIDDHRVTITLGTSPIELPEPLAGHLKALVATRRSRTGKHVTTPGPWLFPSQHPDRPALPETITHRLQRIGIQPTAHRTTALLHLAGELPPAVLGDLLGFGRTAVQEWSTLAARPWAGYVADRLGEPRTEHSDARS